MIAFLTTYWLAAVPTALVGVFLLGALKKIHDEKAKSEQAPAPLVAPKK